MRRTHKLIPHTLAQLLVSVTLLKASESLRMERQKRSLLPSPPIYYNLNQLPIGWNEEKTPTELTEVVCGLGWV